MRDNAAMPNATELKFGDPDGRIAQTKHWTVLLRPRQPTLGSLVLVCREDARAFSDLSSAAFAELQQMVRGLEVALRQVVAYERINYLMLMMVDPDVHFHVIPRYPEPAAWQGSTFTDHGWPGPPALGQITETDAATNAALVNRLQAAWAE
jgi:diadenosine tetraphosphate (Ap4A) HIT family hydrolase